MAQEYIKKLLSEAGFGEAQVTRTQNDTFGDWTTNVAMMLAKERQQSPALIAQEIKEKLMGLIDKSIIEKVEVAGGYVNFYLTKNFLIDNLEKLEINQTGEGKKVVIDYSAPNIAKPFGIGHLRSTNIGQAIYNIYSALGWECIGDNHLGDWGTQFGKLIVAIDRWHDGTPLTIEGLEKLYVRFHQEADQDETLLEEARAKFADLEKGDEAARAMWQKCVAISLSEFNRVYQMLGVKIDYSYGEAFYEPMLKSIIDEVKAKGITKESEGATIVEFAKMPPAILVKSNGATTYYTRDLATLKFRKDTWNPDLVIYEVGADQQLHFEQVFATGEKMGWFRREQLIHVAHGLIRWAEGKFSTREGKTIHLEEVINRAVEEAMRMSETTDRETAQKIAIGAIKFADLAQDPKRDIIFDWKKVMSLEGNSGPYLMYTVARINSLMGKKTRQAEKTETDIKDEEMALVRKLNQWPEKVTEAAERLSPAVVAEYLVGLAQRFNEFYNKYRVIGEPEEGWRLYLALKTSTTLSKGMKMLGIEPVEKM